MLESVMLINNGKGLFKIKPLPKETQFAPIYGISVSDFEGAKGGTKKRNT